MTKDEALKMALEALNKLTDVFLDTEGNHGDYEQKALTQGNKTILAIKEALAQPEQEPVAWFHLHNCKAYFTTEPSEDMLGNYWTPLYASPPQREWVGLTEKELDAITDKIIGFNSCCGWEEDYARAIEAALKEKNT